MYSKLTKNEWICINIANEAGFDKLLWNDRVIKGKEIINSYLDGSFEPEKNNYLLIKRLNEVKELLDGSAIQEPNIYLDATASGLQILSAISLDLEAGAKVNIGTKERKDVYSETARLFSEMFGLEIEREHIKKPLMTYFYNSRKNIEDYFGEEMAEMFFEMMGEGFKGPQKVLDIVNKYFEPRKVFEYNLPDMKVSIPVEVSVTEDLKFKDIEVPFTYKINKADENQWRGLVPNIVHSLDAWILRYVVKQLNEKEIVVHTIHDSFQVPVSKAKDLIDAYKEAFVVMVQDELFPQILKKLFDVEINYNKEKKETMIQAIKESEYMLS